MQNQGTNHTIYQQQSFNFLTALKKGLPSYHIKFLEGIHLPNLSVPELGIIVLATVILLISLYYSIVLFSFFRSIRKKIKVEYVFLEVKSTDRTLKTPFSTSQLFTTLHSLIGQKSSNKRSISFELVSTREEEIRYILRVPLDDASSIKKILIAYVPGISVKEIPDYSLLGKKLIVR